LEWIGKIESALRGVQLLDERWVLKDKKKEGKNQLESKEMNGVVYLSFDESLSYRCEKVEGICAVLKGWLLCKPFWGDQGSIARCGNSRGDSAAA